MVILCTNYRNVTFVLFPKTLIKIYPWEQLYSLKNVWSLAKQKYSKSSQKGKRFSQGSYKCKIVGAQNSGNITNRRYFQLTSIMYNNYHFIRNKCCCKNAKYKEAEVNSLQIL